MCGGLARSWRDGDQQGQERICPYGVPPGLTPANKQQLESSVVRCANMEIRGEIVVNRRHFGAIKGTEIGSRGERLCRAREQMHIHRICQFSPWRPLIEQMWHVIRRRADGSGLREDW